MKRRPLLWLILILFLAACSSPSPSNPPAVTPTANLPTVTPLPPTQTPASAAAAPAETPPPQLSAQSTFEVIAALRAYVLIVEEWIEKTASLEERQAVLAPLIEYGQRPLGKIFDHYIPDDQLQAEWFAARDAFMEFDQSAFAWAIGQSTHEEFLPLLAQVSEITQEMMKDAEKAAQASGLDPSIYGPDYTGATRAVASLLPELSFQPLAAIPPAGDLNPALQLAQITPFVFSFAGSEIFFTIGTIENASATPQQNVEVEVQYFNFLDEHLGTVRGRLLADIANPAGVYPFIAAELVAGEEEALKDWTRYEAAAFSFPVSVESYQAFDLVLTLSEEIDQQIVLRGQLTNTGGQAVELADVRIGAAAFDAAGVLVAVGDGSPASAGALSPGASAAFTIVIQAANGEPASYQFFAEVVPE
ncbi:MAG: hypothetical protein JW757_05940 [Anaerolineales bacterium]|nr:hypothetical protein [Anaerolineales bacterium]